MKKALGVLVSVFLPMIVQMTILFYSVYHGLSLWQTTLLLGLGTTLSLAIIFYLADKWPGEKNTKSTLKK